MNATSIALIRAQELVALAGVIASVTTEAIGPSPAVRCVLADDSGRIDLIFLGRRSIAGLAPGRRCTVTGRAAVRRRRLVIWNPRYELEPPEAPASGGPPARCGNGEAGRVRVIGDDRGQCQVNGLHAARPQRREEEINRR